MAGSDLSLGGDDWSSPVVPLVAKLPRTLYMYAATQRCNFSDAEDVGQGQCATTSQALPCVGQLRLVYHDKSFLFDNFTQEKVSCFSALLCFAAGF